MIWIRSALFLVGMALAVVVYWPVTMLAWPLPPKLRSTIISGWARFVLWWLKATCGLSHRVSGLERLPETPGVLLCKHQSAWETISLQTIFPPQAWVLKRELLWVPLFGWALAASNPIAINRGAAVRALEQLLREGASRLAEGRWVMIFPEGTRTPPRQMGKFNPGGAILAVREGVPVVPVAHNAGTYWRRREFIKRPGVIEVRVGPPIETAGRKAREVNEEARRWIEETMRELEGADSSQS